jgi:hypothetical protein
MVGVLVQCYHKEGARKVRDWLHALADQQHTFEGDPGSLGLTLALKSLGEIAETSSSYWSQEGGHEVEEELVTSWIARAHGMRNVYDFPSSSLQAE